MWPARNSTWLALAAAGIQASMADAPDAASPPLLFTREVQSHQLRKLDAAVLAVERRRCGDDEVVMAADHFRGKAAAQRRRRSRYHGR